MTDALKDALAYQAAETDVPPADLERIVALGRRTQRSRRAGIGVACLASLAVVTGSLWLGLGDDAGAPTDKSAPASSPSDDLYREVGPVATGTVLHVGNATYDTGKPISGLYATESGAVYKQNFGDVSKLYFVSPDGAQRELGTTGFDSVIGADPTSNLVAWSQAADPGMYTVVVADVTDGSVTKRLTAEGRPWAGWDTPVLSLAGSTVYIELSDGWRAWDLTSDAAPVPIPQTKDETEVSGGVMAKRVGDFNGPVAFIQLSDGSEISRYDAGADVFGQLSADGRFYLVSDFMTSAHRVVRVADASSAALPSARSDEAVYWSPDGRITIVRGGADGRGVETCDPESATCEPVDYRLGVGSLWTSGQTAER